MAILKRMDGTLVVPENEQAPHDTKQVEQLRMQLSKDLAAMKEEYLASMRHDPVGATSPNVPEIDQHFIERWEDRVRIAINSKLPVVVEADAMRNWINNRHEKEAREKRYATPMHQLLDLDEFELSKVGQCRFGTVWMNNEMSITVGDNGEVRVFPHFKASTVTIADIDSGNAFHHGPWVNYTPRDLTALYHGLRIEHLAKPLEHDLRHARIERANA